MTGFRFHETEGVPLEAQMGSGQLPAGVIYGVWIQVAPWQTAVASPGPRE